MPESLERPQVIAVEFDGPLRYNVNSFHNVNDPPYLVQLDDYSGNGSCQCRHFAMRCEPLLRRRISPEDAVASGQIKLKENRHVEDALRCEHLITARNQFCDDVIARIYEMRKRNQLQSDE